MAIVLLSALACSCSHISAPRSSIIVPGFRPTKPEWYSDILGSPKRILYDVSYPPNQTMQSFQWGRARNEWTVTLPSKGYAYAGIVFRQPADMTTGRAFTRLSFKMKPARMAEGLSIALVDGEKNKPRVIVDAVLPKQQDSDGWAEYNILLLSFPDHGTAIDGDAERAESNAPFDWSDVKELRIVSAGGLRRKPVVIRHLGFRR